MTGAVKHGGRDGLIAANVVEMIQGGEGGTVPELVAKNVEALVNLQRLMTNNFVLDIIGLMNTLLVKLFAQRRRCLVGLLIKRVAIFASTRYLQTQFIYDCMRARNLMGLMQYDILKIDEMDSPNGCFQNSSDSTIYLNTNGTVNGTTSLEYNLICVHHTIADVTGLGRTFWKTGTGCEEWTSENNHRCIQSISYPSFYGNNHECNVNILLDVKLQIYGNIRIEGGDELMIGNRLISYESNVPSMLPRGSTISWRTDSIIGFEGWRICLSPIFYMETTALFTAYGACKVEGFCVESSAEKNCILRFSRNVYTYSNGDLDAQYVYYRQWDTMTLEPGSGLFCFAENRGQYTMYGNGIRCVNSDISPLYNANCEHGCSDYDCRKKCDENHRCRFYASFETGHCETYEFCTEAVRDTSWNWAIEIRLWSKFTTDLFIVDENCTVDDECVWTDEGTCTVQFLRDAYIEGFDSALYSSRDALTLQADSGQLCFTSDSYYYYDINYYESCPEGSFHVPTVDHAEDCLDCAFCHDNATLAGACGECNSLCPDGLFFITPERFSHWQQLVPQPNTCLDCSQCNALQMGFRLCPECRRVCPHGMFNINVACSDYGQFCTVEDGCLDCEYCRNNEIQATDCSQCLPDSAELNSTEPSITTVEHTSGDLMFSYQGNSCNHVSKSECIGDNRCGWNDGKCHSCSGHGSENDCNSNGCVYLKVAETGEEVCKGTCVEHPDELLMAQYMELTNAESKYDCQHQCINSFGREEDKCMYASFIEPSVCFLFFQNDWIEDRESPGPHTAETFFDQPGRSRFTTFECILDEEYSASPSASPVTSRPSFFPSGVPSAMPTTPIPSESPITSTPSRFPTTSAPTRQPTTSVPSNLPTTSIPSNCPSLSPSTTAPTTSPTTAPTTRPTSDPTSSPLFSQSHDCVNMHPDCSNSDVELLGVSSKELCCKDGGGKVPLSGETNDAYRTNNIATDLIFDADFTYSFWVHIVPHLELMQILQLTYVDSSGEEMLWDFIHVINQKVVISLPRTNNVTSPLKRSSLNAAMSSTSPITSSKPPIDVEKHPWYFKCETWDLSKENDKYMHFNSIHFVHDSGRERFILWLNGQEIECNYDDTNLSLDDLGNIGVRKFVVGGSNEFGDLSYTRHALTRNEVDYFTEAHYSTFDHVENTAWFVVYFAGSVTAFLWLYAYIGWKLRKSDMPDFFSLLAVGFGILDVTSDWQLAFELRRTNHELLLPTMLCCVLPAICGIMYFVYWYRKHTSGEDGDLLKSWLLQYRVPFFALMVVSSSNLGFFKILWSRCNPLYKSSYALFNIPLTYQQQVSLMKGKIINVLFEELPLFFIQGYILTSTDASSNSNDMDRNSELAVMIASVSTILGFLMNAVQFFATREDIGEANMRKQHIIVLRPKRNISMLSHSIASNFREDYLASKVFVWTANKKCKEYIVKFYHNHPNEAYVLKRIADLLQPFLDEDSEMYAIPNSRCLKLIENMLDLNTCMDTTVGKFRISDRGKTETMCFEFPIVAKDSMDEFKRHFQEKVLPFRQKFELDKWYNIEDVRLHQNVIQRMETPRERMTIVKPAEHHRESEYAGFARDMMSLLPSRTRPRHRLSARTVEMHDENLAIWSISHPFSQRIGGIQENHERLQEGDDIKDQRLSQTIAVPLKDGVSKDVPNRLSANLDAQRNRLSIWNIPWVSDFRMSVTNDQGDCIETLEQPEVELQNFKRSPDQNMSTRQSRHWTDSDKLPEMEGGDEIDITEL